MKKEIFISHSWGEDLLNRNNHSRCIEFANKLKKVGLKKIIETIVNQSWLSPKKETPNFLTELLVSTNFYKLEYMNDSFLVDSFNKIYDK